MSSQELFEDSQFVVDESSSDEVLAPNSPEIPFQQAQPDLETDESDEDLANQLPRWQLEVGSSSSRKSKQVTTPHVHHRPRKRCLITCNSDNETSGSDKDENDSRQSEKKRHASAGALHNDLRSLKSILRNLCKKVESNEQILRKLVDR